MSSIQGQLAYDPWGRTAQLQGSLSPDFQYAGYYVHNASGLNLTMTRAYSSNQGRFINRDPIAEAAGVNLFRYAFNNPINWNDPLGLAPVIHGGVQFPDTPQPQSPGGNPGAPNEPMPNPVPAPTNPVNQPGVGDYPQNFCPVQGPPPPPPPPWPRGLHAGPRGHL